MTVQNNYPQFDLQIWVYDFANLRKYKSGMNEVGSQKQTPWVLFIDAGWHLSS